MTDNINNDDIPFGWDSPEEQEKAAFSENDTGEDICETYPDPDLEIALTNHLHHMKMVGLRFVADGMIGEFRFRDALVFVSADIRLAHCLSPAAMKLSLSTIGDILDTFRSWIEHDRAPGCAMPGLQTSVESLALIVEDLNRMGGVVAQQHALERKRARSRGRRRRK